MPMGHLGEGKESATPESCVALVKSFHLCEAVFPHLVKWRKSEYTKNEHFQRRVGMQRTKGKPRCQAVGI